MLGEPVVAQLRVRRDVPGALVALADGRYAVTGPLLIVGSRQDITSYARRRIDTAGADECAWLQTVIGALAADVFAARPTAAGGGRRAEAELFVDPAARKPPNLLPVTDGSPRPRRADRGLRDDERRRAGLARRRLGAPALRGRCALRVGLRLQRGQAPDRRGARPGFPKLSAAQRRPHRFALGVSPLVVAVPLQRTTRERRRPSGGRLIGPRRSAGR